MLAEARLRRVLRDVRSPAALWLLLRMTVLAAFLPLLKRILPLPTLVRLATPRRRAAAPDPELEHRVVRLSRILYRSQAVGGRDNCLERSLLAFRHLLRYGADPRLVVGFRKSERGHEGHVWVTLRGTPIHDDPRALDDLVELTVFDSTGRARASVSAESCEPGGAL